MRTSTKVATTILAASVASFMAACHHHHPYHHLGVYSGSWDDDYYVDNGYGYMPMYYWHPIWIYPSYGYHNGYISNHTAVVYRTRSGGYAATSGGRVSHVSSSGGRVSRGGFGRSGHTSSAS